MTLMHYILLGNVKFHIYEMYKILGSPPLKERNKNIFALIHFNRAYVIFLRRFGVIEWCALHETMSLILYTALW